MTSSGYLTNGPVRGHGRYFSCAIRAVPPTVSAFKSKTALRLLNLVSTLRQTLAPCGAPSNPQTHVRVLSLKITFTPINILLDVWPNAGPKLFTSKKEITESEKIMPYSLRVSVTAGQRGQKHELKYIF